MNTCGNCKHWQTMVWAKDKTHPCGAYLDDATYTTDYMSCPRHALKVEYPKWDVEFHQPDDLPPVDKEH